MGKKCLPAWLILLLLACPLTALAQDHGDLVQCVYSCGGGMENVSQYLLLEKGDEADVLTVHTNFYGSDVTTSHQTSRQALRELNDYLTAAYAPDRWADLPYSQLIALDAPVRTVLLTYQDGFTYAVSDSKDLPEDWGNVWQDVEAFLKSYMAKDKSTFTLILPAPDGGSAFAPELSRPEKVRWVSTTRQSVPAQAASGVASCDQVFVFSGRIPGRTELIIRESGSLIPAAETPPTVYVLEVDEEWNVRLAEKR